MDDFRKFAVRHLGMNSQTLDRDTGVFDAVSGVLAGKPMDETYSDEYRRLLKEVIGKPDLPIVFNVNIGHAMPRCIIPFGVDAVVDAKMQVIRFTE